MTSPTFVPTAVDPRTTPARGTASDGDVSVTAPAPAPAAGGGLASKLLGGTFGPLNVAAYVTWFAVAWTPLHEAATAGASLAPGRAVGVAALVVQLLLFVAFDRVGRAGHSLPAMRALALTQGAAALVAIEALLPNGSIPVLLILVAAQLAPLFMVRGLAVVLFAINGVLAASLLRRWPLGDVLPILLPYVAFQLFAALTTTYARRAEQARDQLGRINAELVATRQLLLESARSEERLRLSRELHDVAGHKLTALKLQLRVVASTVPSEQRATVAECAALADQLLADVRGVVDVFRLHDGIDLEAALTALVPSLPRPRVTLRIAEDLRIPRLAPAQTLLRCAQEALTNALRHGDADHVRIELFAEGGDLVLRVDDDGRATTVPAFGNGLNGMAERLAASGGRLALTPRDGGGLRVRASIPATTIASPDA